MPEDSPTTITHAVGTHGHVRVDIGPGTVEVRATQDRECQVSVTYLTGTPDHDGDPIADGAVRIERPDGELVITSTRGAKGILGRLVAGGHAAVVVRVLAPPTTRVTATTVGGAVTTQGMQGGQAIRTVRGDVSATDAMGDVRVTTVSGDVLLRGGSIRPTVSTTSGDVVISGDRLGEVRVDAVNGDVELSGRLSDDAEHAVGTVSGDLLLRLVGGYRVAVRAVSGAVRVDGPVRRETVDGQRIVIVGDARARIRFRTVSGDLDIRATDDDPALAPIGGAAMLALLQAVERGEIDVEEASRRLEVSRG